ncbi:hypothetical protein [Streptomyces griseofuscus]|uniref:hypothetical protein n=1 Tax=Streptomyces griseofuscus TaxID=146922 RepID=UPI000F646C79|nr:hypothetical protein [Streptomyces griseofuscus]
MNHPPVQGSYGPLAWVSDAMHGMYPDREGHLRRLGLRPADDEISTELPVVGLLGAADWRAATCVLASPCIDHSSGRISALTASVAGDLLIGLRVAEALGLPMVSFLGSGEETHLVPSGEERCADWQRVAEYVAGLGTRWARGRVDATFVRTGEPVAWATIKAQTAADHDRVPQAGLDGLHRLVDDNPYPRGTRFTYLYDYYRSNISHYRRPVIEALAGVDTAHVLVVENVQQIKCVAWARALNDADGIRTSHLVTCPAPDATNSVRVSRAEPRHRIMLADVLSGQQPGSAPYWAFLSALRDRFDAHG